MDPIKGVEIPQGTPASAPAEGKPAATPPAQGGASAAPATGQKVVPISALHEERDKRQAAESKYSELEAKVAEMEARMAQYQQPVQQQPQFPFQQPQQQFQQYQQPQLNPYGYNPAYQQAPVNIKEQIDALYQEDIRKGFQAEMMAMMQYRDAVEAKVDQEVESLRKAPDFSNYEGKVRAYVRGLPIDAKSQPGIVNAAYLMIKGQDADNIIKQREAEWQKKYQGVQAQGAAGINGTFGAPQQGSNTLNAEEVQAAAAMGMTPEEYLKFRG